MLASPWVVPAVLLPMLAASTFIYWVLVRRWTVGRRWANLSEWAASNEFHLSREEEPPLPEALAFLPQPKMLLCLSSEKTLIAQVQTASSPGQDPITACPLESAGVQDRVRLAARGPAPVEAFDDRAGFSARGRPARVDAGRAVHRVWAAAPGLRELGNSAVRAPLPPDLALLLAEGWLVLDFSTRPFDPLEFQRMCRPAQQLVAHLPIRKKPGA